MKRKEMIIKEVTHSIIPTTEKLWRFLDDMAEDFDEQYFDVYSKYDKFDVHQELSAHGDID